MHESSVLSKKPYYPWLIWFLVTLFFFYKYLLQFSPSVMTSELMAAFSIAGAGLGNLAACFYYPYLLMQFPVGILLDKFNPPKIIACAVLLCGLGIYLFSHSTSLAMACFSRGLIGCGAAFAPIACFKIASLWFSTRRFALIAGLTMTLSLIGAMNTGYPLARLVGWFGWRDALMYLAIPGFLLALVYFFFIPNPSPGYEHEHIPLSIKQSLKEILLNKQTWLLSLYSGFAYAPFSVLAGLWGVPFLQAMYELPRPIAAGKVSLMFVGFAIGSPMFGWISSHIGKRKIIILIGTLLTLLTLSSILYAPAALATHYLGSLMLIFGIGMGGFLMSFSMVREVNKLVLAGTAIGFMNMFDSLWEAVSEPLIGMVLDLGWTGQVAENGSRIFSPHNYQFALSILPLYFIFSLICLFFVKETHGTQQL